MFPFAFRNPTSDWEALKPVSCGVGWCTSESIAKCLLCALSEGGMLERWAFGLLFASRERALMLSCKCCSCIISIPIIF